MDTGIPQINHSFLSSSDFPFSLLPPTQSSLLQPPNPPNPHQSQQQQQPDRKLDEHEKNNQSHKHGHKRADEKVTLRLFNLELLCASRDGKKPNPKNDPILAVFYSFSQSYGIHLWTVESLKEITCRDQHNNDHTPISSGLIFSKNFLK